ncbi:MAG: hypothetical protein IPL21_09015 [Saprospirales bacterium]|nr:hypothetical protein [Saprospirales bacterium]
MATDPVTVTFGLCVKIKQVLGIDAEFSYQGQLGFSPHVGIVYEIKKKKKIPSAIQTTPTAIEKIAQQ